MKTFDQWEAFFEEVQRIKVEPLGLPQKLWLSATKGDKDSQLSRLDHWPKGIKAEKDTWRDFTLERSSITTPCHGVSATKGTIKTA